MGNTQTPSFTDAFPADIAARIRAARDLLGMNRLELAEELGCAEASLKNLERGSFRSPRLIRRALDYLDGQLWPRGYPGVLGNLKSTEQSWLVVPTLQWNAQYHGPAALLDAGFQVVEFHGNERHAELDRLLKWCRVGGRIGVRLYKGPGGSGKTRLALELCKRLTSESNSEWTVGFVQANRFPLSVDPWCKIDKIRSSLLIVVDYAGNDQNAAILPHLFEQLTVCPAQKVRLLFLDRDDIWVGRFIGDSKSRHILNALDENPVDCRLNLIPLASTPAQRNESFQFALKAYQRKLNKNSARIEPPKLSSPIYNQVLLIHMLALLAAMGVNTPEKEKSILMHVMRRERDNWVKHARARGIPAMLLPAIEEAVYYLGLPRRVGGRRGAASLAEAEELLSKLRLLSDRTKIEIHQIALLLRECYPGPEGGIEPLQPDLLLDYLCAEFGTRKHK
jgi:DNA-binding XRE family transcriptional regulator